MAPIKRHRLLNTSRVMREIWINKHISRIQIAKNLGLDKSTVSSIVAKLIDGGIIREHAEGEAGPQGGRKPVYLTLDRSYACVLGIEFRPESYTAVTVDLQGEILYSKFELIHLSGENFKEIFFDVTSRIRTELANIDSPLLGIGVGVSGVVDPQRGIIRYSIPLQMEGEFDFRRQIAEGYDLPLFLENDAIKDWERFHEKTGVGIGIVINGRVHYGHRYSAGEFRSIFCTPENKGQFSLSEKEAFRVEEDPEVRHRFIRELAKNIAMMVNTFNLHHVFLGGDIERYKREVHAVLAEEIERNWPYPDEVRCKIRFSSLGDKSVAYGAAGMVLHRLFADIGISESVERIHPGGPTGVELINKTSLVGG